MSIIEGAENMRLYRLAQMRSALKLEILGMKHSRGSVYALAKRALGIKGSKEKVLAEIERRLAEMKGEGK